MDYAAVVSLVSTIQRLLNPWESRIVIPNPEKEFISEEVSYLQSFLDKIKFLPSNNRVDETRVRDAANKLEDLIDSHLSHLFLPSGTSTDDCHQRNLTLLLSQHLPKLRQEIATCSTDPTSNANDNVKPTTESSSDGKKKKIVGIKFNEQLQQLKYIVSIRNGELILISITGMPGIGKTTLVREIYNDPLVTGDFQFRSFLRIGPQYKLEDILRLLLGQLDVHSDKTASIEELFDSLHRSLYDIKYLIVLEDIWDDLFWDMLRFKFPDKNNGSRIIYTTQIASLHCYRYEYRNFHVPFLEHGESWNLLREAVFTSEERCSPQLEKIGKKIAKKCEGLPLAILQVAELLSKAEKTVEIWEEIAEKEDPIDITIDDNTPLSEALSLSYRMLPQYLKVRFLYMAVFPKGFEVTRSKIIQLWVNEGFVEPRRGNSLEDIATDYFHTLIFRSVVLDDKLCSISTSGFKTCKLHFTFRSLCVSEAKRECLFPIIKKYNASLPEDIDSQRRLCIHNNIVVGFKQVHKWLESAPNVRSLLFYGPRQRYPIALYSNFRLLKVLDALALRIYEFPYQILGLFHLRYLTITYDGDELPPSLSRLWNLEVLIVHRHHIIISPNFTVYLPMEIWKLHKLKHLECMGYDLPDPSSSDDSLILEKLLTIVGVSPKSCTGGVLGRIPNLARIAIQIVSAHDSDETFSFFGDQFASLYKEFRSFKCVVMNPNLHGPQVVPSSPIPINFPVNVMKITLSGCAFPWEYMTVIAALPNLQVLKLRWYAFSGPEWSLSEEYFPKLEFLMLEDLDLQHWETENRHFPKLQRLIIRNCYKLETMPSNTLEYAFLKWIEVDDCTDYVSSWAEELQDDCQACGLTQLQLRISSPWEDKKPKS